MKPQDLLFIVVLVALLVIRRSKWLVWAGIICLLLSIPLFSFWIFFTAQRLVYYSAGFFLASIIILLVQSRKE